MRVLISALVVLVVPHLPMGSAHAQETERRYAFLIGVAEYQYRPDGLTDLDHANDDVWALRDQLVKLGWNSDNIFVLATPTSGRKPRAYPSLRNIVKQWNLLTSRIEAEGQSATTGVRNGSLIVHISGHGIQARSPTQAKSVGLEPGATYFVPGDARTVSRRNLLDLSTFLLGGSVGEKSILGLSKVPLDRKLLLYDACRRVSSVKSKIVASQAVIDRSHVPTGLVVFFSCQPGQESFEDSKLGHGLFTHSVVEGLRGKAFVKSELTIDSLVAFVKASVKELSKERQLQQTPFSRGAIGDWVLAKRSHVAQPSPKKPPADNPSRRPSQERISVNRSLSKLRVLPGEKARVRIEHTSGVRGSSIWVRKADDAEHYYLLGEAIRVGTPRSDLPDWRLRIQNEGNHDGYVVREIEIDVTRPSGTYKFAADTVWHLSGGLRRHGALTAPFEVELTRPEVPLEVLVRKALDSANKNFSSIVVNDDYYADGSDHDHFGMKVDVKDASRAYVKDDDRNVEIMIEFASASLPARWQEVARTIFSELNRRKNQGEAQLTSVKNNRQDEWVVRARLPHALCTIEVAIDYGQSRVRVVLTARKSS